MFKGSTKWKKSYDIVPSTKLKWKKTCFHQQQKLDGLPLKMKQQDSVNALKIKNKHVYTYFKILKSNDMVYLFWKRMCY